MKVAFATEDGVLVNAHFGQSPMFTVFEIRLSGVQFLEHRRIAPGSDEHEAGKIASRIGLIEDCALIFLVQIGASAAAQVTKRTIMPVKVAYGSSIEEQVQRLQHMLVRNPPMWLAKILHAEEGSSKTEA
ncbi:NifB/NifX family molybdenum-iron cluster-binding protein [Paenibacillus kribbensis]|uniref:NifB/NifX family molybdenum-iron cluster-binding protein n=1 Tax=Paenibacillus kribbensis TaxID=172713 RepID=UPI0015C01719|nr:NifB/NifX family molybdenum-iron cluster-binding protein [Paenibacillus kribbensis]